MTPAHAMTATQHTVDGPSRGGNHGRITAAPRRTLFHRLQDLTCLFKNPCQYEDIVAAIKEATPDHQRLRGPLHRQFPLFDGQSFRWRGPARRAPCNLVHHADKMARLSVGPATVRGSRAWPAHTRLLTSPLTPSSTPSCDPLAQRCLAVCPFLSSATMKTCPGQAAAQRRQA